MNVSVVIPALNEALVLENALKRIVFNDRCEVIVVDGGSSDGTADIASRYTRVIKTTKGRALQMNTGAREASGEVILFLHADTLLPEGALNAIRESLSDHEVIGGRFRVKLDHPGWQYRLVGVSINLRDRLINGFTGDQAIFIRTSAFKNLGGYREIALMEDLEMGWRMCRLGRVARLPQYVITSARRWRGKGIFRTIILMWWLKILYILGCPPEKLARLYGDIR